MSRHLFYFSFKHAHGDDKDGIIQDNTFFLLPSISTPLPSSTHLTTVFCLLRPFHGGL
jgi:hypothetical protein